MSVQVCLEADAVGVQSPRAREQTPHNVWEEGSTTCTATCRVLLASISRTCSSSSSSRGGEPRVLGTSTGSHQGFA